MSTIASKNLYDLLGNDPEQDPEREPEPPTKAIDKPVQRAGKRNAGPEGAAPSAPRPSGGGRGGRPDGFTRGDQAGSTNNRSEKRDDGARQDRHPDRVRDPRDQRDGGRGRGGRGRGYAGRGRGAPRDDRHNHSGIGEHEKQAAHGWGAEQDGQAEWADEKAGDAIASAEVKDDAARAPETSAADPAFTSGPADAEPKGDDAAAAAPVEEEDNTKSYDQYLAELAEKRQAMSGNSLEFRKANEGSKQNFPEGKAIARDAEEDFISGTGGKARKEKENKQKNLLTMEGQYYAPADMGGRGGGRGGRGDSRGGRGRGDRGDREGSRGGFRGERSERGEGRGRGSGRGRGGDFSRGGGGFRGDRAGGERGGPRGLNPSDESAFPSLGGK